MGYRTQIFFQVANEVHDKFIELATNNENTAAGVKELFSSIKLKMTDESIHAYHHEQIKWYGDVADKIQLALSCLGDDNYYYSEIDGAEVSEIGNLEDPVGSPFVACHFEIEGQA